MKRRAAARWLALLPLAFALGTASGAAGTTGKATTTPAAQTSPAAAPVPATRNGREIYARFREGLADPSCGPDTSQRWQRHFAAAPGKLAARDNDVLPLFGYVVDALREAHLPTEYALIPFVESGYKPGARSGAGPAGLWQFIALTARDHKIPIRPGYDGRLSPVESTRAAVRYLKTLHGMFAGDWRLAVMAYNAGEYRVLGALKRSGQRAMDANPSELAGLSGITHAYVRKLHALSCVLDQADDREDRLRALDRPVAVLAPQSLPTNATSLGAWARERRLDPNRVRRINPAFAGGRVSAGNRPMPVLAPLAAPPATTLADAADASIVIAPPGHDASDANAAEETAAAAPAAMRTHVVARGDSIWRLARRYGVARTELLERNGLSASDMLHPGMVLKIDPTPAAATAPAPESRAAMPE